MRKGRRRVMNIALMDVRVECEVYERRRREERGRKKKVRES